MHVLSVHVLLRKIQMSSRSCSPCARCSVVRLCFIKAPVLNSGDEDSGKLKVSCGKHAVIQNTYEKSETDRINEGYVGRITRGSSRHCPYERVSTQLLLVAKC